MAEPDTATSTSTAVANPAATAVADVATALAGLPVAKAADAVPQQIATPAPTVKPVREPSSSELAVWNQSLSRVVGYVTTNGTIQISICGMFATGVGILVALADPRKDPDQFRRIYEFVLPTLCLIVLTLSTNVYGWIATQLAYVRYVGVSPDRLRTFPTYDEFKDLIASEWSALTLSRRIMASTVKGAWAFIRLPLAFKDIYCYYCLLYILCGVGSLAYGLGQFRWWSPLPFLLVFLIGTHDVRQVSEVKSVLPQRLYHS